MDKYACSLRGRNPPKGSEEKLSRSKGNFFVVCQFSLFQIEKIFPSSFGWENPSNKLLNEEGIPTYGIQQRRRFKAFKDFPAAFYRQ